MNRLIREIWKESSFAEAVTEITARQTARRMAQVALEGRFGTLSDELLAALKTADETTLESIVAHITSDTLEQIRARLGLS
ncbi:MAG TPA: hypothetical protein VH590_16345 [Ktedonobacterales bacterium]|jgi:hypothetical protein